MTNLVSFGDSYTDEARLEYFFQHGRMPPPGAMLPPNDHAWGGGRTWPRVVAATTGARSYNYAVGGAMCSNALVNRTLGPLPFPSVADYQLAAFHRDLAYADLYPDRRPDNTVYSLWIGTNDLGIEGFLADRQQPGVTLASFVDCVWDALDGLYALGARQLVLFNTLPLQFAPMYADPGSGGTGNHQYWRNKTAYNTTEYQYKMQQYATSVNTLFDYGVPFHLCVRRRWPGAVMAIFDVHALTMDVRARPAEYLDAPANITGPYRSCFTDCVESPQPLSSFMWYDELHPSARMDEIFATHFVRVVAGDSKYATRYSG